MKLQKMNNRQFFITLPSSIVKAKGWKKGDSLDIVLDNKGNLFIKPQREASQPEP